MEHLLLREYFWNTVIAVLASAGGLAIIALSLLWSKRKDVSLLAVGTTSLLYGLRLLASVQLDQFTTGAPPRLLLYFDALSTYVIPVPLSGFLLSILGKGWKNSMLWAFRTTVAFAAAGILSDLLQATPGSLMSLNSALVILWALLLLSNGFLGYGTRRQELNALSLGFACFGLFAVNENLVRLRLVPWTWSWEELGFMVFLSSLGYVAARRFFVNEARLLTVERELEIAREIQSSILPRSLPATDGIRLAARYVPMASVAGDFYDVLVEDEQRLCLLVADVSGHGVGAALIASMLKVAFASQHHVLSDPARVLAGINRTLSGKLDQTFVTAGCLFLDMEKRSLCYAGAGHPPLLLFRKTEGKIHELNGTGTILGPFPQAEYTGASMDVTSGDRLILYTDGIIETKNGSGLFFEGEPFRAFITAHADRSPEAFADTLLTHLSHWSGKSPGESLEDDLTLIVVDVL